MPPFHYVSSAHETVRPFVVLAVARVSLADDVVARRKTEERAASVVASFPHLEDHSVHDLSLHKAKAVVALHVINNPCIKNIFLFYEVGYHSWFVIFSKDRLSLIQNFLIEQFKPEIEDRVLLDHSVQYILQLHGRLQRVDLVNKQTLSFRVAGEEVALQLSYETVDLLEAHLSLNFVKEVKFELKQKGGALECLHQASAQISLPFL